MKILYINTNTSKGGAARVCNSLRAEMESLGHQTFLLSADNEGFPESFLKMAKGRFSKYFHYLLANDIEFYGEKFLYSHEFKEADIVHCHNLHGWYFSISTLAKIGKLKPVLWTLHDMWAITPHCAHTGSTIIYNGFYQCESKDVYPRILWHNESHLEKVKSETYKKSNFILTVPSKWLLEKVNSSVLSDKPIELISNGIDTLVFHKRDKQETRKKLGLPLDKKIILSVFQGGNKNPFKGWEYFQELARTYENDEKFVFLVIGAENHVKDGSNTKMIQYINSTGDLADYYSAADMYLLTSIAENAPLVILEAMSCGLPILCFDVGGIKEVVTHKKDGYLASPKNIDDLKRGFEFILNLEPDIINNIEINSRNKIVNDYNIKKIALRYNDLYERIKR